MNKFLIFAVPAEKGKVLLGNVGYKDPLYLLNPAKVEDQDFGFGFCGQKLLHQDVFFLIFWQKVQIVTTRLLGRVVKFFE